MSAIRAVLLAAPHGSAAKTGPDRIDRAPNDAIGGESDPLVIDAQAASTDNRPAPIIEGAPAWPPIP